MVKVIEERHCKPGEEKRLEGLLDDMRTSCMRNPSYISGEILVNVDDPLTYMIVGTWTRPEGWKAWQDCQERQELLQISSACIDSEPKVTAYTAAGNGLSGFEIDEHFASMHSQL